MLTNKQMSEVDSYGRVCGMYPVQRVPAVYKLPCSITGEVFASERPFSARRPAQIRVVKSTTCEGDGVFSASEDRLSLSSLLSSC